MLHRPYGPRGAESEDPEFWTDLTRNSDFLPEPGTSQRPGTLYPC